jgi:hypothetical protein
MSSVDDEEEGDHLTDDDQTNLQRERNDEGAGALNATIQAAKHAHEASLAADKAAQDDVKVKFKAKQDADQERTDAHKAKEAARGSPNESPLTTAWKRAIEKFKVADSDCKKARVKAKETDKARKEAWEQLSKARAEVVARDKAERDAAARDFHANRSNVICAPRQANEGLKPWDGCPGVTHLRLKSAQLPPLDGHEETTVDGQQVRFEPIIGGVVVLVAGTGGMKTVRTLDFMLRATERQLAHLGQINAELPFVFVTSRINLAHKFEADLKGRGIDVHNYKNCPSGTSVGEWIEHPYVIISIEQVEIQFNSTHATAPTRTQQAPRPDRTESVCASGGEARALDRHVPERHHCARRVRHHRQLDRQRRDSPSACADASRAEQARGCEQLPLPHERRF